eukprot:scaffold17904_cov142-Skeletonema_marinoi.AAC.17
MQCLTTYLGELSAVLKQEGGGRRAEGGGRKKIRALMFDLFKIGFGYYYHSLNPPPLLHEELRAQRTPYTIDAMK